MARRDISFLLMLNEEEKEKLENMAKNHHISMNAFVRMKIFRDVDGILRRLPKKTVNNQKKTQHQIFMEQCNSELKTKLKDKDNILKPMSNKELEDIILNDEELKKKEEIAIKKQIKRFKEKQIESQKTIR